MARRVPRSKVQGYYISVDGKMMTKNLSFYERMEKIYIFSLTPKPAIRNFHGIKSQK